MAVDENVQCTERDEFVYNETISFLPLCAHPSPSNVLIIGPENGGIARQVTKHPLVKKVTQLVQDQKLVEICKKHFPKTAIAYESPKLRMESGGITRFLRENQTTYDVIILDVNDKDKDLFKLIRRALEPKNGIFCCSSGLPWLEGEKIAKEFSEIKEHFGKVEYATASTPSCPSGKVGFFLASVNAEIAMRELKNEVNAEDLSLRYYTSEMHEASFALPYFVKKYLR